MIINLVYLCARRRKDWGREGGGSGPMKNAEPLGPMFALRPSFEIFKSLGLFRILFRCFNSAFFPFESRSSGKD